ncbi:MAG: alginate export family protein [Proteobacteria bacterium]|nr:alginate export family protein [Pseudomonadota bacterium]
MKPLIGAPNLLNKSCRNLAKFFLMLGLAAGFTTPLQTLADEDSLGDAIRQGKFIFNGRLRYEDVANSDFAQDASGLTFRARFGYKTAAFKGFSFLAEGDFTRALGVDNFNSTVNGKTTFPVIADANSLRLNQLYTTFTGIRDTTIRAGRQRVKLDNDRFIGNVGFRQNEQTFDAALFQTKAVDGLTLTYAYVIQVNRIFGSKSPAGQLDTNTHLFNVAYDKLPIGTLTAFAYFINVDGAATASNQTYGLRLTGNQSLGKGFKGLYELTWAHQKNYKNSPAAFSLDYFQIAGGLSYQGATAKVGYELLEGNGSQSFRTPLATLHAFQGWADVFLATPASGIEDLYFSLGYKAAGVPFWGAVSATVIYHDFSPDIAGPDLGEEVDFKIAVTPEIYKQKVTFSIEMADFSGSPILPDVRKIWLTATLAF